MGTLVRRFWLNNMTEIAAFAYAMAAIGVFVLALACSAP